MIEATADITKRPATLILTGAPVSAIVEFRSTNLMNGASKVIVVETDANGTADIALDDIDYGFNCYVKTLDASNKETIEHLIYAADSTETEIHLITEAAYAQSIKSKNVAPDPAPAPVVTPSIDTKTTADTSSGTKG